MADITPVLPGIAGTAASPVSASAGGDALVTPTGRAMLRVINGGGGSINVTVAAVQTSRPADGTFPAMTLANQVVAVAAGATKFIGPFAPAFIDANGKVQISYSGVSSVTIDSWRLD